jgi:hypothetical protein
MDRLNSLKCKDNITIYWSSSINKFKEEIMEELREKLIKSIEENGRTSLITVHISQELDRLIVGAMKGEKV